MTASVGQCIVCRRSSPRGLEPLIDSEGNLAVIHMYHRASTVIAAGFSIRLRPAGWPPTPGAWSPVQ
jgi:hypothetical protein